MSISFMYYACMRYYYDIRIKPQLCLGVSQKVGKMMVQGTFGKG